MGTWCYTTNATKKWEYCKITKCPDDSIVAWTSYDATNRTAKVLSFEADPEIVKQRAGGSDSVTMSTVFGANQIPAEYWTLCSDYKEKKVFFLDYRSAHFGVHDLNTNKTSVHLEGMGGGVEMIAFDWMTKNLFWTDSEQNWVMVSDSQFKHYTPIYRPQGETPYALSLHARKRILFLSLFKTMESKIVTMDMSGNNLKVLFKFPEVFDVTGMTVDYTDDKLYWTDFTGFGSLVVSSNLDGTNKTRNYFSTTSIMWGVASYLNYIYTTDVRTRFMSDEKFYYVWWISKTQTTDQRLKLGNYRLGEKPRGITVMSDNEEYSLGRDEEVGSCTSAPPCDHICLPMVGVKRVCACAVGYELKGETQCISPLKLKSNSLLLADQGQAKIFQLGISNKEDNKTAVLPLIMKTQPYAVDVSQVNNLIYFSDIKSKTINQASWDGRFARAIIKKKTVKTFALEAKSQLIFYADDHQQYIYISGSDGMYQRPIMTEKGNTTRIGKIALDVEKRHVYWVDTYSKVDTGRLLRMNYDGSERKVLMTNIHWPDALAVDIAGKRVFVGDSRVGLIYELAMADLETASEASSLKNKTWDVGQKAQRSSSYISDIKYADGYLYLFDKVTTRVERFEVGEDTGSLEVTGFGPALFYKIHSFTVFSKTQELFISSLPDPCRARFAPCRHLCIPTSKTASKCLCHEGFQLSSGSETECSPVAPGGADTTPPEPLNCPDDITLRVGVCQASTVFKWDDIVWQDDKTDASKLVKEEPATRSLMVSVGKTTITSIAKDEAGNVGECIFTVFVDQERCPSMPTITSETLSMTPATCIDDEMMFNVSCVQTGYLITNGGSAPMKQLTVKCQQPTKWVPSLTILSCLKPLPIPVRPATTSQKTPATVPTTTTTSPPTTTPTRTPATAHPTTKTRLPPTTKSTEPVPPKTKAPEAVPKSKPKESPAVSPGLNSGDQIAIAVVCLVVIALLMFVGVVYYRRSAGSTFTFPIFWKQSEDTSTLETNQVEGSHSYSVFN